jgi:hypothetical protein
MKHISELQKTLSHFFDWNKARLDCLAQILQALFAVRTVNLTQIAAAFQSSVKEASSYRRVCRFFTGFSFDISSIVLLVFHLFPFGDKYTLILDRTNWKWGKFPINILVLSVAYLGISIPVFWVVLDLEGTSCVEDRVAILKQAIQQLGVDKIEVLLADREFIGTDWFEFLIANKIPFVIRIKQNSHLKTKDGGTIPAGMLRKHLGRQKVVNYSITLWGHSLYVSVERRRGAKEQMIVVSNVEFENPLALYRRRWEIETLFGCLKGRGFRMEDTHMVDADKIEKLLFVLVIGFCWAYRTGDIKAQEAPIEIKAHGRKARSLFREGLNWIRRAIFGDINLREFRRLLACFTCLQPMACAV